MKDNRTLTVNQLFAAEQGTADKKLVNAATQENVATLKERLAQEVKVLWPVVCRVLLNKLMESLDEKVSDVMVAAWAKYQDILQYKDEQQYPPDETYLVLLVKHTIESVYNPYLEININNQPVGKINFEIEAFLTVEGIHLEIKGGKIMKIHTGSCQAGGSIKCEGITIIEKKTKSFTLPGTIRLGEGVNIPDISA